MLNPEFRLLDPEIEHLERLKSLAGPAASGAAGETGFENIPREMLETIISQAENQLATPGDHAGEEVIAALHGAALNQGISGFPEGNLFGWKESFLKKWVSGYSEPKTLALGILDAEGIWAGVFAGISCGRFDYLSTWRYLWSDEPELASKQSLDDIAAAGLVLEKRFGRPVQAVFIYKNEFLAWRDQAWSIEALHFFVNQHTAVKYGW